MSTRDSREGQNSFTQAVNTSADNSRQMKRGGNSSGGGRRRTSPGLFGADGERSAVRFGPSEEAAAIIVDTLLQRPKWRSSAVDSGRAEFNSGLLLALDD